MSTKTSGSSQKKLSPLQLAQNQLRDNIAGRHPNGYKCLWARKDGDGTYILYGYYRDSWLKEYDSDEIGSKLTREDLAAMGVHEAHIQ